MRWADTIVVAFFLLFQRPHHGNVMITQSIWLPEGALMPLSSSSSGHHHITASWHPIFTHGNTRLPLPLVSWQQATEPRRRCWGRPGSQDDRMLTARVWTRFFTNHYPAVSQPSLWKRPQGMTNTPVAGPAARLWLFCVHCLQIIVCVCLCVC